MTRRRVAEAVEPPVDEVALAIAVPDEPFDFGPDIIDGHPVTPAELAWLREQWRSEALPFARWAPMP